MRKTLIAVTLCLATGLSFGQMKTVNSAFNEAKAEKPDLKEARAEIKSALENPETKDEAKTWYVAGFIENKAFENERNKQYVNQKPEEDAMYTALLACYNYYLKAAELDQRPNEKGKVKPKYLKDIKKTLKSNQVDYINGGAYYFDQKEFGKAYDQFNAFLEIPKLPFMQDEQIPIDTNYVKIKYYAALAATQMNDPQLAIRSLEDLKNDNYNPVEVYQYLVYEYQQTKDTANLVKTLEEGATKFKEEPFFVQSLINLYITTNELDKAIQYLDQAIEADPQNAQLWNVKGQLYENLQKDDLAIECFDKAIALNPEYAEAYGNKGRVYYNQAVKLNEEINSIKDNKVYNERRENELIPAFQKALPLYEKAHALNPGESQYKVALRGIYYNLNMGDELSKIEAEM